MMMKSITSANLEQLAASLLASGMEVIAPAKDRLGHVDYHSITQASEMLLGQELPRKSLKGFFLPQTEGLFYFQQHKGDVELAPVPTAFGPRVVIGAKPCDAAAMTIVDKVMDWDYHDELWFGRRESTTIISLACAVVDQSCFCTAVDIAPDTAQGADMLLVPVPGGYHVEVLSPKGEVLVSQYAGLFTGSGSEAEARTFRDTARAKVEQNLHIDTAKVREWVEAHFDHEIWHEVAQRCHGCGACTYVCPTCHCFDIVDEVEGVGSGTRRRSWDTCQAAKFTLHASGHNPRPEQCDRCRQRVSHKFNIYPNRFGVLLCTGCGRCVRVCAAGVNIVEIMAKLDKLAAMPEPVAVEGGK
jgi:ferredoxin